VTGWDAVNKHRDIPISSHEFVKVERVTVNGLLLSKHWTYMCPYCGAVVLDCSQHLTFHLALERFESVVKGLPHD
jgi:hypothetical protein